jgi:hypothetical protein
MLKDFRNKNQIEEDKKRADEYAKPGSVQHFLLRFGFMPGNEEQAEAILTNLILEREAYWEKYGDL